MKRKLVKQNYLEAIARLKKQKKHNESRIHSRELNQYIYPTITIALIAKELDINPSTLRKTKDSYIIKDMDKYMKIKSKKVKPNDLPARNTLAYYKELSRRRASLIKTQKRKIEKMQIRLLEADEAIFLIEDMTLDMNIIQKEVLELRDKVRRLTNENMQLQFKKERKK